MGDRMMLGAATFFGATTAFTTAVSVRQPQLPDEPFGIRFPGPVPVHLALGLGSGVAAPWPMPVGAMIAAIRAQPGARWSERTCAILGAVVLVGTLAEPASWGFRPRSASAKATVSLNLLSGVALFLAGTRGSEGEGPTRDHHVLPSRSVTGAAGAGVPELARWT